MRKTFFLVSLIDGIHEFKATKHKAKKERKRKLKGNLSPVPRSEEQLGTREVSFGQVALL